MVVVTVVAADGYMVVVEVTFVVTVFCGTPIHEQARRSTWGYWQLAQGNQGPPVGQ